MLPKSKYPYRRNQTKHAIFDSLHFDNTYHVSVYFHDDSARWSIVFIPLKVLFDQDIICLWAVARVGGAVEHTSIGIQIRILNADDFVEKLNGRKVELFESAILNKDTPGRTSLFWASVPFVHQV